MGGSKNEGTPKLMVLSRKTLLKWMIWGYPMYGNTVIIPSQGCLARHRCRHRSEIIVLRRRSLGASPNGALQGLLQSFTAVSLRKPWHI